MKVAVLGTGMVGQAVATRLVQLGHSVTMGSRTADNERGRAWVEASGADASCATFADAVSAGEVVVNATSGMGSLDALGSAGAGELDGKTIIDIANPIVFGDSGVTLGFSNDDSLGEAIQRRFPNANVVKTLNTMNADLMVHPESISGDHVVFLCGNDETAKQGVASLLGDFGWTDDRRIDLGDITAARATEAYLLLWLRLWGKFESAAFNISITR